LQCEYDYNNLENCYLPAKNTLALAFREPVFENGQIISKGQKNLITNQAVIKGIDLSERGKVELKLGSQYIYKTSRQTNDIYWLSPFGLRPEPVINKETAANIRECLGINEKKHLPYDSSKSAQVILPITPESYISYSYSSAAWITHRSDAELKLVNKIRKKGGVTFIWTSVHGAGDEAMSNLQFEYVNTPINIRLGDKSVAFITPSIPPEWQGKLNYEFIGGSSQFTLLVKEGAKYKISYSKDAQWVIVTENTEEKIDVTEKVLTIGNVPIEFAGGIPKLLLVKNGAISYLIDISSGKKKLIDINISELEKEKKRSFSDKDIIDEVNKSSDKADYITVYGYHDSVKKVWYDTKNETFLTPDFRNFGTTYENSEVELVERTEDKIIYFIPKQQVVLYQDKTDPYVKILATGIIKPFINQNQVFGEHKEGVILLLEKTNDQTLLEVKEAKADNLNTLKNLVKTNHWKVSEIVPSLVSHNWYIDNLETTVSSSNLAPDLQLAFREKGMPNTYFFYSKKEGKVYCQQGETSETRLVSFPRSTSIIEMKTLNSKLVAITDEGYCYSVDNEGKPILMGVTDQWLAKNKKSANMEETINHLFADYSQHLETILFLGKDGKVACYDIKRKMLIENARDSQAKEQDFVGYDARSNRVYSINKYEDSTFNKDEELLEENSKLTYIEAENIKNFVIENDSSDSAWMVNKSKTSSSTQINLPLSPQSAYLNKDGSLTVTDEWGKVFLVSENEEKTSWNAKLLAVNQQWVGKNIEKLGEEFAKIILDPAYSYTSGDLVDVFGPKESRGWYDKKNKKLVYVNDEGHEDLVYIGVHANGGSYIFFNSKRKELKWVGTEVQTFFIDKFNDCQRIGEMIYLQGLPGESKFRSKDIPLFRDFGKLMISNNGSKELHLSKKILDHYNLIIVDYFSNTDNLSKLELELPYLYDDVGISTYGSDWVVDYRNSVGKEAKVIITGYEDKKVTLSFVNKEVRNLPYSSITSPWEKKYKLEEIGQSIEDEKNLQLQTRIEILPK